jgi:hypothetical protein
MKNYTIASVMIFILVGLGCKYVSLDGLKGGSAYSNASDKFSIAFPGGSSGVENKSDDVKYAKAARMYGKSFDNRSDNYRSYEVQVLDMDPASTSGKEQREIQEIALNGWEDEPETVVKDINVNGQKGIDSVRSIEIGPAKMTFREVVFWSEKDKKLYVVKVSAVKKENVATKEADDFVHSFKLSA